MKCPFCSHPDTQVVETRMAEDGGFIRRRRQCGHCEKRFTTYERPEVSFPAIVKKDGRRNDYDRSKLRGSFSLALRKRPVSIDKVEQAIEQVLAGKAGGSGEQDMLRRQVHVVSPLLHSSA